AAKPAPAPAPAPKRSEDVLHRIEDQVNAIDQAAPFLGDTSYTPHGWWSTLDGVDVQLAKDGKDWNGALHQAQEIARVRAEGPRCPTCNDPLDLDFALMG